MAGKNIRNHSVPETHLRDHSIDRLVQDKRALANNGILFHHRPRIYSIKMGVEASKLLNLLGITSMAYTFFANLKVEPIISICVAAVSLVYGIFEALKRREDWLYRRSERMEHEDKNKKKKKIA